MSVDRPVNSPQKLAIINNKDVNNTAAELPSTLNAAATQVAPAANPALEQAGIALADAIAHKGLIQKGGGLQVVVGLGQSGLATAHYLVQQGYLVGVTDAHPNPPLAANLPEAVAIRAFDGIDTELLLRAARIVISPGVALTTAAVAAAKQAGVAIVSDIQLFKDACEVPIVAITGSNAKTTVTTLVGKMAQDAGLKVGVGGNIGVPALSLLEAQSEPMQLAVLELSSFQLETISNLGAKVAVVLNMSPDHLDRHGDMLGYHQAKHRIFQGAQSIVINRDDALTRPLVADNIPRLSIGSNAPDMGEYGLLVDGDSRLYLAKGTQKLLAADELQIKGRHNLLNAQAALAIGELAGLPLDSMLTTLKAFAGLAHRCQFVANVAGVDYFNDSKGTNVGSTKAAIAGLGALYQSQHLPQTALAQDGKNKLLLILGGQGKGQQFGELVPFINRYVSQVLLIGADANKIAADLQQVQPEAQSKAQPEAQPEVLTGSVALDHCQTLAQAVEKAHALTKSSLSQIAAVVLSPACASFDQFSGYVDRGEQFCALVANLER